MEGCDGVTRSLELYSKPHLLGIDSVSSDAEVSTTEDVGVCHLPRSQERALRKHSRDQGEYSRDRKCRISGGVSGMEDYGSRTRNPKVVDLKPLRSISWLQQCNNF